MARVASVCGALVVVFALKETRKARELVSAIVGLYLKQRRIPSSSQMEPTAWRIACRTSRSSCSAISWLCKSARRWLSYADLVLLNSKKVE